MGNWVLKEACKTLALWAANPAKADLTVTVNISVVQFSKKDFVQVVLNTLQMTGANPKYLKLELTESLLASNVLDVKAKMEEFQQQGSHFRLMILVPVIPLCRTSNGCQLINLK